MDELNSGFKTICASLLLYACSSEFFTKPWAHFLVHSVASIMLGVGLAQLQISRLWK